MAPPEGLQLAESTGAPPSRNGHGRSKEMESDASSVYKKRDYKDFTTDETKHLEELTKSKMQQALKWFPVFGEPKEQLENWLYFFDPADASRDDSQTYGAQMQQGLYQLWSTFIILEALLVGVATQPFVSTQGLEGERLAYYGITWMLSLLTNLFALAMTSIFLGYLLANPGKLSWIWLCNIGVLRGVPGLLVIMATFMSLFAIAFTTFAVYGWKVGIGCIILEAVIIATCIWCAILLSHASTKVIDFEKNNNIKV